MLVPENSLDKKKAENPPQEKPTLPVGIDYFLDCPVQEGDCRITFNPTIFSNFEIDQNSNTIFLTGKVLFYILVHCECIKNLGRMWYNEFYFILSYS